MLPGLPPLPNDRDIVLVTEPHREVIEIQADDERVLFIMEPITVPDGGGGGGGAVASVNGHVGVVVLTKADVGLALADNTADTAKPVSTATQTALDLKAALVHTHAQYAITADLAAIAFSGLSADLVGTIPTALLPSLAITDVFPAASQAAMLALTAQRGDVAIRTDVPKAFILASDSPTTLADWKEIPATGAVVSVNGQSGTVALTKASIGLGAVDNTPDSEKPLSTAMVTALTGKADAVHTHTIGQVTGLDAQLEVVGDELDNLGVAFDALEDEVALKAPLVHTHTIGQVTGLQAALGEQEVYGPTGSGLGEWTCDPLLCSTHFATSNGTLILVRHRFRKAMSIDEIGFVLQQAGVTPGAYSGVAVYEDGTGVVNRLAQSADMGAVFTSIGAKSLPLTVPAVVAAGEFRWIGYLWQGSSPPRLFAPPGPPDGSIMNVGRRRTLFLGGQTGFPSTLDIAAMTPNTTTYWFSLKDV